MIPGHLSARHSTAQTAQCSRNFGLDLSQAEGARCHPSLRRKHCAPYESVRYSHRHGSGRFLAALTANVLISVAVLGAATPLQIAQQAYLKASNTAEDQYFGRFVAISGDTLAVGAWEEDSNATGVNGDQSNQLAPDSGAVYVFVRNGTTWTQQAYLKASNTGAGDFFGYPVALSGDTLVVGAPGEDSNATGVNGNQSDNSAPNSGAAYVFVRTGTNWSQQAYLKPSNTQQDEHFGGSLAIAGDTVVVGADWENSSARGVNGNQSNSSAPHSGAAYVFLRSGTNWNQQAYLKASNTGAPAFFGSSVALSGDTIVVGAIFEGSNAVGVNGNQNNGLAPNSGAAYVFVRNGVTWSQQAYLKASNTGTNDNFGVSVAVSGDTVVVGAAGESSSATGVNGNQSDNSAPQSGAVYVFIRDGATWSQQAYIKASNTRRYNTIVAVSISGDTLVIGNNYDDSNSVGLNGDQSNSLAADSGAAYLFTRSGTNWSQQAYLKASNTGSNDYFGVSVALSGDTLAVGAYYESSNATGVNGNQSDNSAEGAGAVYIFTGVAIAPRLALTRDGSGGYYVRFTATPESSYRLQRATLLTGPWETLASLTANLGPVEYHDQAPPAGQAFYQLVR